jgi:23S rRNA (pseudouridine1915-N3)-methyltransferase
MALKEIAIYDKLEKESYISKKWILFHFLGSPCAVVHHAARASVILSSMQITLAHIGARSLGKDGFEDQVAAYLERLSAFAPACALAFRSEEALFSWLDRQQGRTPGVPVLLDSRGKQMGSEGFAAWLGARRDEGMQHVIFAIGPASGWSDAARGRAKLLLSLGNLTLPHALARLVIAEQLYRAFTILTGHPYHCGH